MRHKISRRKRRSIEQQRESQDQQQDDELLQTPVDVPHIAANDPSSRTDVLEVWFAGCHAGALFSLYLYYSREAHNTANLDVGGGSVPDTDRISLAQITLRWMVKQIAASQCGIIFDEAALERHDIDIRILPFKANEPYPDDGCAEQLELEAKQPLHDMCTEQPLWWLAEVIPLPYSYQDGKGVWHKSWRLVQYHPLRIIDELTVISSSFNMGRGRVIPDNGPHFHISVKERLNDDTLNYKPKAQWKVGTERYVE